MLQAPIAPATTLSDATPWPLWRRLLFRFTALYLILYANPLQWFGGFPVLTYLSEFYAKAENWLVTLANQYLFHVKDQLVPLNGSGDTSYGYAQLCFFALASLVGTLLWSLLDKRRNYDRFSYWLMTGLRYYVALVALSYGIIKLFGQQMIFPSLSQLATPLGDLLPMRFSWLFIGYSTPYQFFSGAVEVVAAILLLWRRTATLGALVAAGVFLNVMVLNLCYDIPVKLFSMHLFVFSKLLLANDARRLLDFFVFNRPTQPGRVYKLTDRRLRIARVVFKIVFVALFGFMPIYQSYEMSRPSTTSKGPLKSGVYEVTEFRSNLPDSLRWQNVVFEEGPTGSILTSDTLFRQRYHRGYFAYTLDSTRQTLAFRKFQSDSLPMLTFRMSRPDTNLLVLRGLYRGDSVEVKLQRTTRHFQLAERQFHWLSEANR